MAGAARAAGRVAARRAGAVAVQGLRAGQRRARPRDRARAARRDAACGVLSGPSFALEVARGQPTALVAASSDAALVAQRGRGASTAPTLRVYTSDDPVGVEVGGAVKNVLAIATGIADGLALGPERARGADHARPGRDDAPGRGARRARRDLHGPVGPRRPGAHRHRRPVAQPPGRPAAGRRASALPQILRNSAMWPRACPARRWCWRARRRCGVEMPIREAVGQVLAGHITPARRSSS